MPLLKDKIVSGLLSTLLMTAAVPASAQVFADENAAATETAKSDNTADWGRFYNKAKNEPTPTDAEKSEATTEQQAKGEKSDFFTPKKQDVYNPEDYIYKNVPQIDRPTLDGVERGRTSVVPVVQDGSVKSEGYIYIFYSDFTVGSMMSGSTTCDVKFQIVTTLDRKLNSLAIRLKWPKMETPLNFIDVNPNQKYHFMYTLLGDGCYSMDKIPNIIVNRCRVKGMTQEDCAQRVRWIRKM